VTKEQPAVQYLYCCSTCCTAILSSYHSTATVLVSYPGKGECADPVNEDAILEEEGGGESPGRNRERQLASDTGGGKT
jgi:hypothetical protein